MLAIALREFTAEETAQRMSRSQPAFAIRIGLHTGPLVAGVIGDQRFTYDLWGDTVNTASRLESGSEPGRINISGTAYKQLETFFQCTPRGRIEVKNRTSVDMYFLDRFKPEFSGDAAGLTGNDRFQEAYEHLRTG